ncbi:MAG: ribonuclease III [Acidimicrobiales bacterium]
MKYQFDDWSLVELAMTHRSYIAENPGSESNERLEFLGDSVVGLAVTDYTYNTYSDLPEGELAKLRASVVNTSNLASVAQSMNLGSLLRLGKGEASSGGRQKESILADCFEAVIGALFVDGGWESARAAALHLLGDSILHSAARPGGEDFKTRLQELASNLDLASPTYRLSASGPDHDRRFAAVAFVGTEKCGEGQGTSKKRAEQAAAEAAWNLLSERELGHPTRHHAAEANEEPNG